MMPASLFLFAMQTLFNFGMTETLRAGAQRCVFTQVSVLRNDAFADTLLCSQTYDTTWLPCALDSISSRPQP